jgi:hypothetical protein
MEREKKQAQKREAAQKKKLELKQQKAQEHENERKAMELKMKTVIDSNADRDVIQAVATEFQVAYCHDDSQNMSFFLM